MKNRIIKQAVLLCLTACTAIIVLFACSKSGSGYGGGSNNGGGNNSNSVSIANFTFPFLPAIRPIALDR